MGTPSNKCTGVPATSPSASPVKPVPSPTPSPSPAASSPIDIPGNGACTWAQLEGINAASDKMTAVLSLMSSDAGCGTCLIGCAAAANQTACALGCGPSPSASPSPAVASSPSAAFTYPPISGTGACSWDELKGLADASDKMSAVMSLMSSDSGCGTCLIGCATATDQTACALGCGPSPSAAPSPAAKVDPSPSSSSTFQYPPISGTGACSWAALQSINDASDKLSAVMSLMSSDAGCGTCLIGCATATDQTACALHCGPTSAP